jgi:hypothetical protein
MILAPVFATPDRVVQIHEQLLGTSADGYFILRTETDNLGSYFSSRTKRYLDEHSKNADAGNFEVAIGERIRTTLLVDVATSIDPESTTPKTKESHTEVHSKDSSVLLADMLLKFPVSPSKWDDESFRRLTLHQKGGVRCGAVNVVSGGTVIQDIFENRYPELDWVLDEVMEDMNCLFLKVSKRSSDEVNETKFICIPPRRTQQVKAHLTLRPFYLIAGTYATLEEARKQALALDKKCREAKYGHFHPEIWSLREATDKMVYVIADPSTMWHIEGNRFSALKNVIGVELIPRSSERFVERFTSQ